MENYSTSVNKLDFEGRQLEIGGIIQANGTPHRLRTSADGNIYMTPLVTTYEPMPSGDYVCLVCGKTHPGPFPTDKPYTCDQCGFTSSIGLTGSE